MPHMSRTLSRPPESPAALWLRLDALLDAVDDIRSAALVVSNMARHKDDRDLAELAKNLYGVHSTVQRRLDEVLRELRQSLANNQWDQNKSKVPASHT